jgi:hypothetical protein
MGGCGGGNWYRWQGRKSTVEESLVLAMREFCGRLHPHAAGTFTWTWTSGSKSSVGWFVTWGDVTTLTVHHRWRDSEDVRIPIRLQTTSTQFGGRRWWFTCPLIVNGVACNRRVGKLYLPPGARYFGCRTCHRLTYRSCQEAHQSERTAAMLARELGCDRELAEMLAAHDKSGAPRPQDLYHAPGRSRRNEVHLPRPERILNLGNSLAV